MSETTFALMMTFATFAGMAAWPIFLDGFALWTQRHPLQRLMAEIEKIDTETRSADGLELDPGI